MNKNEEKGIIETLHCRYNTFDGGNSQRTKCSIDGYYCDVVRSPNCYYKQLQREKQKNEKTEKTLKEIEEIAKNLYNNGNQPPCIGEADCPYNGGIGFDNHCDENCHMILGKKISEKIKEVENERQV